MIESFTFGIHSCSFTSMIPEIFVVWQTYLPFLLYAITSEIVHVYLYTILINTYDMSTDSHNYLHLAHFS